MTWFDEVERARGAWADTFARSIVVYPLQSDPGKPPVLSRGIYRERPVDVMTEDGAVLSSTTKTLDVRLSEFIVQPVAGDLVELEGARFRIDDTDDDGQGGSLWTLKEIRP